VKRAFYWTSRERSVPRLRLAATWGNGGYHSGSRGHADTEVVTFGDYHRCIRAASEVSITEHPGLVGDPNRGAVGLPCCAFRTAILREVLVNLSDFRSRTHPEFGPADATRCHSLPLAGRAILGADLREWLFLLVTA
jgi:hypothetical protein